MSRNSQSTLVGTILAAAILAGCAGSKGTNGGAAAQNSSTTIGSAGGELVLAGTVDVEVPPGALTQDTVLGAAVQNPPVGLPSAQASDPVALTPHGTAFARPVHVDLSYSSAAADLAVLRLADDDATAWQQVGGVTFANGKASFESTTFSYYVLTSGYKCTPLAATSACTSSCTCCGTASCVNLHGDVNNCGACGNVCPAGSFCANGTCAAMGPKSLCANPALTVVHGELPPLTVVSPEETTDGATAKLVAQALVSQCGTLSVATVSQAQQGVLDPCSDAPLYGGGNTLLVVGGNWSQRLARWADRGAGPLTLAHQGNTNTFTSRAGATLARFNDSALTPAHDYFMLSTEADPVRGALVFQAYGVGWQGTPAALWYFNHTLLPALQAGTLDWSHYVLVEWTDNGDGSIGQTDTFTVLAKDTP